jgi:hypothetical protein
VLKGRWAGLRSTSFVVRRSGGAAHYGTRHTTHKKPAHGSKGAKADEKCAQEVFRTVILGVR